MDSNHQLHIIKILDKDNKIILYRSNLICFSSHKNSITSPFSHYSVSLLLSHVNNIIQSWPLIFMQIYII